MSLGAYVRRLNIGAIIAPAAGALISFLRAFVVPRNLGLVRSGSGAMRILPDRESK